VYFEPYGPFWPERAENREGRYWRSDFWEEVEETEEGLSTANGVYIFSMKFGQKLTPWYVGKTCANGGFAGEVFQDHKLDHYYQAEAMKRGQPLLHLIALTEDNRGNFCRKSARAQRYINRVETYLIELALTQNPNLRNDKKTKFRRELDIVGVIGDPYVGRRTESARTLRKALGL
jgi:hypothetical protein